MTMTDSDFDDMIEGGGEGALQRIIGLMAPPVCFSSVELELCECADLSDELELRRMRPACHPVFCTRSLFD
jgi:hypothetical protein